MDPNTSHRSPIDRILSTTDLKTKLILLVVLIGISAWTILSAIRDTQALAEDQPQQAPQPALEAE